MASTHRTPHRREGKDSPGETSLGGARRGFEPTGWTIVLRAKGRSRDALESLIRAYWKPAYFFVRRWGAGVEDAKDLTQGFFAEFLARDFLKDLEPQKGRFRSFLLTALRHFLVNQAERERARKRGGGRTVLSLDFSAAESEYSIAPAAKEDLDREFRRQWALTVLARALEALRAEILPARFEALRRHLAPGETPSYEETARLLGAGVTDVKNLLHRARRRYRELIRAEVRGSVDSEAEVDGEIRDLFNAV